MATGLTHIQRNNREFDEERKRTGAIMRRIAERERDASSMWEALIREGEEHLIDGVLSQREIDALVRDELSRGGWKAVNRLMCNLPQNCNDDILRIDGCGCLSTWSESDMSDAINEAADNL